MIQPNVHYLRRKVAVVSAVFWLVQMGAAIAQSQAPNANATAGLLFKTSSFQELPDSLNRGALTQRRVVMEETQQERGIQYENNCPIGKVALGYAIVTDYGSDAIAKRSVTPMPIGRSEVPAWFMSKKTPPAAGLRVMIRNLSLNLSLQQQLGQMPYTDREYDKAPHSEQFTVAENNGTHQNKFLAVKLGTNDFSYEIKRGEQVLESGTFTTQFSQQYRDAMRVVTIPRPKMNLPCIDAQ
jgi:hypothetical protein